MNVYEVVRHGATVGTEIAASNIEARRQWLETQRRQFILLVIDECPTIICDELQRRTEEFIAKLDETTAFPRLRHSEALVNFLGL